MSDIWTALAAEIQAWHAAGKTPTLWWRDDDAVRDSDTLRRMARLAKDIPLGLAVIPKPLDPNLSDVIPAGWSVLQHGFAHINHEPPEGKKSEFGPSRQATEIGRDLAEGRTILATAFGERFLPLFVPPWNRITPDWVPCLTEAGLTGLSVFKDRKPGETPARLNTHVDILDWQAKRRDGKARFVGTDRAVGDLIDALSRRRTGRDGIDPNEPVGILTHHLEHDEASWSFLERLIRQDGLHWADPKAVLTAMGPPI